MDKLKFTAYFIGKFKKEYKNPLPLYNIGRCDAWVYK